MDVVGRLILGVTAAVLVVTDAVGLLVLVPRRAVHVVRVAVLRLGGHRRWPQIYLVMLV